MNFKISLAENFWANTQEQLPAEAQESLLDLFESMRERPGDVTDRGRTLPANGVASIPITVLINDVHRHLVVVFQYDADETTLHVNHVLMMPMKE